MSDGMVGLAEEPICDVYMRKRDRSSATNTDLEDGLHLSQLRPGMLACQHLDDQTTHAPNVCFGGVACLFDDLGCHPKH